MKRRMKLVFITFAMVMGVTLVVSQFLMSQAQEGKKTQKAPKGHYSPPPEIKKDDKVQQAEREEARKEVAESPVGSMFHNILTAKENEWTLLFASHGGSRFRDDGPLTTTMSYQKGKEPVHITIQEYTSAKFADESFDTPRSYGASVKFDAYGDRGEKIYGQYGFSRIIFRKGNIRVGIGCNDEKTAERFSSYALEAMSNFVIK